MMQYVATFHTHLSALLTCRALTGLGVSCKMAPVPRKISSSCGTCVFYTAENPQEQAMDQDVEGIFVVEDAQLFRRIFSNE